MGLRGRSENAFWRTERTTKGVSLITTTGIRNMHRVAEYQGLLGNRKESSWNRLESKHDCCGAKVSWRHQKSCPIRGSKALTGDS